jgi:hypothetical protein
VKGRESIGVDVDRRNRRRMETRAPFMSVVPTP